MHRMECSACGCLWSGHPTVRTETGWATACPNGRAVRVEYIRAAKRDIATDALQAIIDYDVTSDEHGYVDAYNMQAIAQDAIKELSK